MTCLVNEHNFLLENCWKAKCLRLQHISTTIAGITKKNRLFKYRKKSLIKLNVNKINYLYIKKKKNYCRQK